MTDELTKALLLEEVASREAIASALFASVTGDVPLVQALVDTKALGQEMLARYLARSDAPQHRQVVPLLEVVEMLPPGLCARLLALPVRRDAITGTVDVVVADANDPHPAREIAFHIGAPVRLVRAAITAIEEALHRLRTHSLPAPPMRTSQSLPASNASYRHTASTEEHLSADGASRAFDWPPARPNESVAGPAEPRSPDQTSPVLTSDDDRLFDSRPRANSGAPPGRSFRGNTLPPADPALRVPGAGVLTDAASAEALRPSRLPGSQRQAHVVPGLGRRAPRPSVTPPWGTDLPMHEARVPPSTGAKSEPPRSGLGSEIPIPLTRRTFAAVSGGTQRPPPFIDPRDPLGEGYAVDVANLRQIVEVNERSRVIDASVLASHTAADREGDRGPQASRITDGTNGFASARSQAEGLGARSSPALDGSRMLLDVGSHASQTAAAAMANTPSNPPPGVSRASANPRRDPLGIGSPAASFIPGPPPLPSVGPFNAFAAQVALSDIGGILAALRAAGSRDEVLELVLTGARMVAHRVGIFVVKRGGYLGWACTTEFGDRASLQAIMIPLESPSVFDEAVRDGLYLGPLRHDETHAALLHVMRGASRDVAAVPIRVSGRTAVVILADELGDTMLATRRLEELARAAGDAFMRIVRMRR